MSKLEKMSQDIEAIKTDVALIKQDAGYIKERVTKVETAIYSIGGVIVLGLLTAIINFFIRAPK
jgi:hypothetical protein